jgi:hypothetical protein
VEVAEPDVDGHHEETAGPVLAALAALAVDEQVEHGPAGVPAHVRRRGQVVVVRRVVGVPKDGDAEDVHLTLEVKHG